MTIHSFSLFEVVVIPRSGLGAAARVGTSGPWVLRTKRVNVGRSPEVSPLGLHPAPDCEAGEVGRHVGVEGIGHVVTSNRYVYWFEVEAS